MKDIFGCVYVCVCNFGGFEIMLPQRTCCTSKHEEEWNDLLQCASISLRTLRKERLPGGHKSLLLV